MRCPSTCWDSPPPPPPVRVWMPFTGDDLPHPDVQRGQGGHLVFAEGCRRAGAGGGAAAAAGVRVRTRADLGDAHEGAVHVGDLLHDGGPAGARGGWASAGALGTLHRGPHACLTAPAVMQRLRLPLLRAHAGCRGCAVTARPLGAARHGAAPTCCRTRLPGRGACPCPGRPRGWRAPHQTHPQPAAGRTSPRCWISWAPSRQPAAGRGGEEGGGWGRRAGRGATATDWRPCGTRGAGQITHLLIRHRDVRHPGQLLDVGWSHGGLGGLAAAAAGPHTHAALSASQSEGPSGGRCSKRSHFVCWDVNVRGQPGQACRVRRGRGTVDPGGMRCGQTPRSIDGKGFELLLWGSTRACPHSCRSTRFLRARPLGWQQCAPRKILVAHCLVSCSALCPAPCACVEIVIRSARIRALPDAASRLEC